MRLVQLTMVVGRQPSQVSVDELEGEDDGLSNVVPITEPSPAEVTTPVMVDASKVRCFYPRKKNHDGSERRGTRITFDNGAGMAVTELFNDVAAAFGRAN